MIVAVGPQNLYVIEQGLKKKFVLIVCTICALSDFLFIVIGVMAFSFFSHSNLALELVLNTMLFLYLLYFIRTRMQSFSIAKLFYISKTRDTIKTVILKTLGFTYLNPHVYSDTVLILGGVSKDIDASEKHIFVFGASLASFIYFFCLGYGSSYLSRFITNEQGWRMINLFVSLTMSVLAIYIFFEIITIIKILLIAN
ncbi:LysE family transporter [Paracoccaceae bacterium]|nr:LysE family transporter [Paracoccaceae bacterium]